MTTRRTRRAPLALGALLFISASAIVTACSTDIPTAAEVRDADAQTVVQQLGLPSGSGQIAYYVDGEKMATAESVPAEQIASIEVRRKRTAGELSEVYIRTLGAESGDKIRSFSESDTMSRAKISLSSDSVMAAQPMYIIDGVIISDPNMVRRIDPKTIESIEVLKGDAASKLHGARGANGVIQIKTKK